MSIRKRALLLVPVLLVLACTTFAIAGNIVDYTYDADGNITDAITSTATSVNITASPTSILPGGTATLSWTSTNADSCTIDQGIGNVPLSGAMPVTPAETTTYTITATREASTATSSVTVTVTTNPPPTVSITANPASIQQGGSSTLTWTSTNAESCTIDQGIGPVDCNSSTTVSPSVTTTYTITATGPGGTATANVTITVTANPPPAVTISADPASIPYGGSSTITWSSTNADWCDIQPDVGTVSPSGFITVSPLATTTYTITAYGLGGTATTTVTITVASAPAPTVQISANPATIVVGSSTTLTWTSTNAVSCDIQPDVGTVGPNWSIEVSPSTTTTYTITATGPGGTATDSVTVTVTAAPPAPTVSISANPATIQSGASSALTWSSTNATSCSINQGIGTVNTSGSITVSPTETTTYTITATGLGGTTTASATITVTPPPPPQSLIIRPNGAGDETNILYQYPEFSGLHYDKVAEATPDEDTTYVYVYLGYAAGVYFRDLYNLANPSASGTINWVKVWIRAYGPYIPYGNYAKTALKTGGTVYEGADIALTISYDNYYTQYATNPQTGVAWTWADISNLQAGVSLKADSGYYASCTQVYVEVNYTPAPVPTVQISANPASIDYGASSTLTWTSTNATTCAIDQGIGVVNTSGATTVTPTANTTYTVTATGPGGTATASVIVTVAPAPAPTVLIGADPATIQEGGTSTLTWSSTDASSCTIDQGIGSVAPNGSTTVSPTETTIYTITATGPGGTVTNSVTVTVTPPPGSQTIIIRPEAVGDETNISSQQPSSGSHYDKVDEETPDESSTYVAEGGASIDHRDLYVLEDLSLAGTINWIKVWMRIGNTSGGGGYAKTAIKTEGSAYEGTPIQSPASWTNYDTQYTTNPQTGVAWTWDDINDLQAGVSLRGGGWLTGWGYRKPIALSRPSGAVTNYQMKLLVGESAGASGEAVDCGGNCKTDFSDLRFVAADGTTLLPYWIESISGSTPNRLATIWIKFDSIGTTATTFYMYYGNSSASSLSNGADTFIAFDDFERGSNGDAIGGNWTVVTGNVTISTTHAYSGTRSAKFAGGANIPEAYLAGAQNANQELRVRFWRNAGINSAAIAYTTGSTGYTPDVYVDPSGNLMYYDGSSGHDTGKDIVSDAWNLVVLNNFNFTANTCDFYLAGALAKAGAPMWHMGIGACAHRAKGTDTTSGHDIYFDNIIIRNFRTTEPAWGSWGGEDAGGLDSNCTQVYVEVNYIPSTQPTVSISANPATIQEGGSSTLTWLSTNADSCTIDQGIGTVNTSGSTTVSPTATTTYTITATGAGGTATNSVTVTALGCEIYLHDETIAAGSTIEHTTACTITAGPNYIIEANATVTFRAGEEIILSPGFEARQGCEFRAMHTQ